LAYGDTDSLYYTLSEYSMLECIIPEKLGEFLHVHKEWFPQKYCPLHRVEWIGVMLAHHQWDPSLKRVGEEEISCCKTHYLRTKRTPGLWKLEASGDSFLGANEKCYALFKDSDPGGTKLSCAGVSRNLFNNLHVQPGGDIDLNTVVNNNLKSVMHKVIFDSIEHQVQNRNILRYKGSVWTNVSMRRGFSPLYMKRKIDSDSYHISLHDVVLRPRKKRFIPLN
jgi:hypothetical protein